MTRGATLQPIIEVRDLTFRFEVGDFGLRVPKLTVAPREKVAILGASGSGKTTLLHLIAGILTPIEGRIHLLGKEISACSDRVRREFRIVRIGLVFQQFELIEYLTVFDNVLFPHLVHPRLEPNASVRERARELLRTTGLSNKERSKIDHLSQGEKQRVAICRALLHRPDLLLADEPTGNLDASSTARVMDALLGQADESGAAVLTVTHDTTILDGFDRVVDLDHLREGS